MHRVKLETTSDPVIFDIDKHNTTVPCPKCQSTNLGAIHCFGAMVVCKDCKHEGPWVSGTHFQTEEQSAVWAWNKAAKVTAE